VEELTDRVYDSVRDQLHQNRQRVVIGLWRMPIMNNTIRIGLVAAAALVVVVIGIQLFGGGNVGGPPDATPSPSEAASSPSEAASSPSAVASPGALPILEDVALTPGTYSLEGFPVSITFDVPTGWRACSPSSVEQAACQSVSESLPGVAVAFTIIDNVVANPCSADGALLDPPVGSSVDDLVTAISNLQAFQATTATDITFDGFDGKQFTLTAPSVPACQDLRTWAAGGRTNGMGAGEVHEMRILDVGGVRVVIAGVYFPSIATADQLSALQQVIDSIQIEP
jgi:hypothetical protein